MGKRVLRIVAALACSVAVPALADKIVDVDIAAGRVAFTVDNSTKFPLTCDGTLTAKTKNGTFVEAAMKTVTVAPGATRELFITTHDDKDPFVDGWSNISCATPPAPSE